MSQPYSTHRKARNPVDAIRLFCLECCGSSLKFGAEYAGVRDCPNENMCSLWPYRFGKNPKRSESFKKLHAERRVRQEHAST